MYIHSVSLYHCRTHLNYAQTKWPKSPHPVPLLASECGRKPSGREWMEEWLLQTPINLDTRGLNKGLYGGFWNGWYLSIIRFDEIFTYKPFTLGNPHLWKPFDSTSYSHSIDFQIIPSDHIREDHYAGYNWNIYVYTWKSTMSVSRGWADKVRWTDG